MRICCQMARQRRVIDAVAWVALSAGLVVFLSLFFPAIRRVLAELGFMTVYVLIIVAAGLVGCGIYRLATREGRMKAMIGNPFAPPTAASDQTWNDGESEAVPDFLYPMLRRRYPWRH